MDYLIILRNTKGFKEFKTVIIFKRFLWAIEPQFPVLGGNCSDTQGRPAEDSTEETMYQVVFGFKSASNNNSFYFFSW